MAAKTRKTVETAKARKTNKKVVVNRAFLLALADDIYDPKTKRFLRLCIGTLQNGPDPTDEKRSMHCGLGELYFAMTGMQPEDAFPWVDEDGVVEKAVELSELKKDRQEKAKKVIAGIKSLKLPAAFTNDMIDNVKDALDEDYGADTLGFYTAENLFREILNNIPNVNDDSDSVDNCGTDRASDTAYRNRARRVAAELRKAAKFLPR